MYINIGCLVLIAKPDWLLELSVCLFSFSSFFSLFLSLFLILLYSFLISVQFYASPSFQYLPILLSMSLSLSLSLSFSLFICLSCSFSLSLTYLLLPQFSIYVSLHLALSLFLSAHFHFVSFFSRVLFSIFRIVLRTTWVVQVEAHPLLSKMEQSAHDCPRKLALEVHHNILNP